MINKTTKQILYFILILFSLVSCEKKKETDEEIIGDILPQLIDSLNIRETNLVPVPPAPLYDKDSNFIGIDTLVTRLNYEQYQQKLKQIDLRESLLLVGVVDSCLVVDLPFLQNRAFGDSTLLNQIIKNHESLDKSKTKWNLDLIEAPTTHQFIFESELENTYSDIWEIEDRKFCGLIAVSTVYLDQNDEVGFLQLDRYPYYNEGASYFIIIERREKKWGIKRILLNWIS